MKGKDILQLQTLLNKFLITADKQPIQEDASFGEGTTAVVKEFQVAFGLVEDGIVGPKTMDLLLAQDKQKVPGEEQQPINNVEPLKPRKSTAKNTPVTPVGGALKGLDLSHYQPDADFKQLVEAGFAFCFLKSGEGLQTPDSAFQKHRARAAAAGMPIGAYHFYRAGYSPEAQANFLLKVASPKKGDLLPVLDLEDFGNVKPLHLLPEVMAFMAIVEAAIGRPPILYASPSFINEMGNPQDLFRFPLWIANYKVPAPHIPPPWNTFAFWQNAEEGAVKGINAKGVDHNIFNGTKEDLQKFIL